MIGAFRSSRQKNVRRQSSQRTSQETKVSFNGFKRSLFMICDWWISIRFLCFCVSRGAIHSTKISGNFGTKLNGSVRSNQKSFKKTGPPFYKVDNFSQSNQSKFWLSGSHPSIPPHYSSDRKRKANPFEIMLGRGSQLITTLRPRNKINKLQCTLITI